MFGCPDAAYGRLFVPCIDWCTTNGSYVEYDDTRLQPESKPAVMTAVARMSESVDQ